MGFFWTEKRGETKQCGRIHRQRNSYDLRGGTDRRKGGDPRRKNDPHRSWRIPRSFFFSYDTRWFRWVPLCLSLLFLSRGRVGPFPEKHPIPNDPSSTSKKKKEREGKTEKRNDPRRVPSVDKEEEDLRVPIAILLHDNGGETSRSLRGTASSRI